MTRDREERKYERKRKRCTFTHSERAHEFLKNPTVKASRFVDSLIINVKIRFNLVVATISQKTNGLVEIRTRDLRRVKKTS